MLFRSLERLGEKLPATSKETRAKIELVLLRWLLLQKITASEFRTYQKWFGLDTYILPAARRTDEDVFYLKTMRPLSSTDCFRVGTIADLVATYYSLEQQETVLENIGWRNIG